jgi:MtN3 and saliva related transmembrane protein
MSLWRLNVESNLDLLGYVAALLTTVAFLPQAVKTIRSRDTRSISFWTYAIFTTGIALWLAYGVALHSWPIILSNVVVLPLAATILAFKIRLG